jgi:signal transduction histidine kinase
MSLPHLMVDRKGPIIEAWLARVYDTTAPQSMARKDVVDSMSDLLDLIVEKLRRDLAESTVADQIPLDVAQEHGRQRFHLGFDMTAIVREHDLLRDVLFDEIEGSGYEPTLREVRGLLKCLFGALADSATHYGIARDRQVRDQAEQYVGFLAHELRNPLSTARLAFSLLAERGRLPEERATHSMERALTSMQELLDGALGRISEGDRPTPRCRRIDVAEFVGAIALESQPEADAKEIQTAVEVDDDLELEADPRLLRSAISNLLRNAIKFSRAGSRVVLSGRRGQGRVTLSVEDGCGGLPPGSVERLFSPFVQAGRDRTGFGLGLAIAKQAAEAHGGDIRVHDLPGRGCVFVVDLPVTAPIK